MAKICSDINKPDGQYIVPASCQALLDFVSTLPLRKVPFIGRVTERMLADCFGVALCGEVFAARGAIARVMSPQSAEFMLSVALGAGDTTPHEDRDREGHARKGISTERTFRPLHAPDQLEQKCLPIGAIAPPRARSALPSAVSRRAAPPTRARRGRCRAIARCLAEDMAREGLRGKTLTLKLKPVTFETFTRALTLASHIHTEEQILRRAHARRPDASRAAGWCWTLRAAALTLRGVWCGQRGAAAAAARVPASHQAHGPPHVLAAQRGGPRPHAPPAQSAAAHPAAAAP